MKTSSPIGPTNHGSHTTSWSPDDGGTVSVEARKANPAIALVGGGAALAGGIATTVHALKASKPAVAAAKAAGIEGASLIRLATKLQAPWVLGGAAIMGAGLIGTNLLAAHFSTKETLRNPMSRDEYLEQGLDDPDLALGMADATNSMAGGVVGGAALASIAQYALAGAPKPIRAVGTYAAGAVGMLAATYGTGKIQSALRN